MTEQANQTQGAPAMPVDYAGTLPKQREPMTSISMTVVLAILTVAILPIGILLIPEFESIFKDFKIELPTITKIVLAFSRWMARDLGWAIILPVPFLIPLVLTQLANLVWPPERVRWGMRVAAILLLIVGMGITVVATIWALFAPMIVLIRNVNAPSGKH